MMEVYMYAVSLSMFNTFADRLGFWPATTESNHTDGESYMVNSIEHWIVVCYWGHLFPTKSHSSFHWP